MKLKFALLVSLFAIGFAGSAMAGAVVDTDADLIPDNFDTCSIVKNSATTIPFVGTNDSDADGYGNRCDADFDNDGLVLGADFTFLLTNFGKNTVVAQEADLDGDTFVLGGDFSRLLSLFGKAPGPSGLVCAGTPPSCTP